MTSLKCDDVIFDLVGDLPNGVVRSIGFWLNRHERGGTKTFNKVGGFTEPPDLVMVQAVWLRCSFDPSNKIRGGATINTARDGRSFKGLSPGLGPEFCVKICRHLALSDGRAIGEFAAQIRHVRARRWNLMPGEPVAHIG